jgi:YHS domain-containing protein
MFTRSFRPLIAVAGLCLVAAGAIAQHDEHQATPQQAEAAEKVIPYLADTCPISGGKLGSMGDPIVLEYDGREVRFCCKGCIKKFEKAGDEGWAKLDAIMIKAQLPYYPLSTCFVSGESLTEDGEDIAINRIHEGRLVRLCCKSCARDFTKDPDEMLERLDAAVALQQRESYPLNTCLISGGELGSMGEPFEMVVGNRLVWLCCGSCEKKVLADPMTYLATLDAAWKKQGFPEALTELPHTEGAKHKEMESHDDDRGDHDDHDDDDHGG